MIWINMKPTILFIVKKKIYFKFYIIATRIIITLIGILFDLSYNKI